ncbi:MAG: thiol protease/hemagglutinin PrtT [Bacteroidales bacterium]|nr:thiol protease/hemagglutinin PrtT [Bacteroidales bacterium]
MKKLSLLFGLMAIIAGLNAGPVDQQRAQQLGTRFMSTTAVAQRSADIQLNLVSVATDLTRGAIDYYVFNVRGGGFVIIAGDDCVKPILAYSTTGAYNPDDVAEGFAYTLGVFQEEIQYVREHHLNATPDIVAEWRSVATTGNLRQGRQARAVVGPLCQTIWNQNFPYNSQCPEDPEGNGGYVYAGCVATAMGQVMKYWNYPEQGTGSYTYNPEGYAPQTANFGETEYHFELMPNSLDSLSTEEDYFYIAQFLHHCGISVDMQYSGHGSGAYSQDVITAVQNYFGYTTGEYETLSFWGFNFYTNEQWAQMLKDGGLDEHIPLYYSGSDDNGAGGHAFVCDGYDENDYFHYNWGWSGRDDAWCPIGALNTTKYAFNDANAFIGHIVPSNSSYYQRADTVIDFTVMENEDRGGVLLTWTNPSVNLQGNPLASIDSISIRRNNQPLVTLTSATVGEAGSYEDGNLEPGLYEYSICVCNTSGISRMVYRTILVGEKCPVTFVLQDEGGDGWKGAAISVTAENGQRIAVISMDEGSVDTIIVPLLKQNLNFIWNHGWYHLTEEYDTDDECSFFIFDVDNNMLYSSEELEDGIFMTYNNNCDFGTLSCYPVENLQGEYQWHNGEEFGAYLTWDKPTITPYLHHFEVYRATGEDYELIAEVDYDGSGSYSYFDNTYGMVPENTHYSVRSFYTNGYYQCESEFREVMVTITDVTENNSDLRVYPNPTTGLLNIESQSVMRLTVTNLLGQKVLETEADGNTVIDLSRYGQGVYMLRIETANGTTIRKVSVR